MADDVPGLTRRLANFVATFDRSAIPSQAYEHAKVAFMDWLAVTIGGKDDPLVHKLIGFADRMGGHPQATILGHRCRKCVTQAALINGASSHALDYDDTLAAFFGHPSVTLFPALLALAEWQERSGEDFLTAYLIGLQTGATIGSCAGFAHYMSGWHATATLGHLASAAGCARLLELGRDQTTHALGIAGTQSSGLKRVFGTMCKPFHAGMAAEAGLTAALLAQSGFTSAEDILEGPLGFFQALQGAVNEDAVQRLGREWAVENLAQKYHASCHATHSPLEAALTAVREAQVSLDEITAIRVHSSQLALDAAGKMEPVTGLEGKFSIPYCVANVLLRGTTGNEAFTDERVKEPSVVELMRKVTPILCGDMIALDARVEVETRDGKVYSAYADILQQIPPLETKRERIRAKAMALWEPELGREKATCLAGKIASLERAPNVASLLAGL
jgi:2-methylcitrate dehydratase PrpD